MCNVLHGDSKTVKKKNAKKHSDMKGTQQKYIFSITMLRIHYISNRAQITSLSSNFENRERKKDITPVGSKYHIFGNPTKKLLHHYRERFVCLC